MELELTKIDYFSVSPVVSNCMKLLPVGGQGHQQQRVIKRRVKSCHFSSAPYFS